VDAFFSFLKVAIIGIFALIALVLVLLAIPQTRFKSTLTEILAWFGFLGASGLVASPVDLIPDFLPVIGWSDDIGYALLALVCGYIGWNLRRRRLTGQPPGRQVPLPFFRETMHLWHGWRAMRGGSAAERLPSQEPVSGSGLSDRRKGGRWPLLSPSRLVIPGR
jgi:hypothetical protein